MSRVLVTGASGFIGRHCLEPLARRGFEVHAVSWPGVPEAVGSERWHAADLFESGSAAALMEEVRPAHLLHLAWIATPGEFWNSPQNLDWVAASMRLLRAFQAAGGERAVVAGSCAEYEWSREVLDEKNTPLRPATLYGVCKDALRSIASAYAATSGLSLAWARIFFLYGPHAPPAKFPGVVIRALLEGREAPCTEGSQLRDFIHVADAGDALAALLASRVEGAVNVASGERVRLRELAERSGELTGRLDLLRLGAIETPAQDPPALLADVRRLREEVGWRPRRGLDEGLRDTIEWMKAHPEA